MTPAERKEYHKKWYNAHRAQHRAVCKAWSEKHREENRIAGRAWRARNPMSPHVKQLKKYGLTAQTYLDLLVKQGFHCAICERAPTTKRLAVDHNHTTGKVRGLLCGPCNRALGYMKDSPLLLRKAADYLTITEHN